jgi:hypothetical protein
MTTNVDHNKVKALLFEVVKDIFDCMPRNAYTDDVKDSILKKVSLADLLTDQPACATVKKKSQAAPEGDGNFYT